MQLEFKAGNNKEYEINRIWDSAVYAKESTIDQLLGFYYLVLWKSYPEEENTKEPILAIQHLQRLVNSYHKDNPEKPTATSFLVNIASPMARSTRAPTKQNQLAGPTAAPTKKRGQLVGFITTNKQTKKF